ncbi:MAG: hypothetical protein AAGB35_08635 [Pseudomonadota bacterium]
MKKILLTGLFLLTVFLFYGFVSAEEEIEEESEAVEEQQNRKPERDNTLEEFVPSEEVSIDKPVAFPVDI